MISLCRDPHLSLSGLQQETFINVNRAIVRAIGIFSHQNESIGALLSSPPRAVPRKGFERGNVPGNVVGVADLPGTI